MIEAILSAVNNWNAVRNERQKLQHAMLITTTLIVVVSGIVSLISANAGHDLVRFAGLTLAVFIVNAIIWNLLYSSVITKLSSKPKRK